MFETSKLDVPFLQGADRWSFMSFQLFSSFFPCDRSFLVLLVSYDLFLSLLLHSGLMFPCRASAVVISCRLLSRGLFLASLNAYRALSVVILLSYVVLWSASCIA